MLIACIGRRGKVDQWLRLLCGSASRLFARADDGLHADPSEGDIVLPGAIRGIGLGIGLVFVPLSDATFATLQPAIFSQAPRSTA